MSVYILRVGRYSPQDEHNKEYNVMSSIKIVFKALCVLSSSVMVWICIAEITLTLGGK